MRIIEITSSNLDGNSINKMPYDKFMVHLNVKLAHCNVIDIKMFQDNIGLFQGFVVVE